MSFRVTPMWIDGQEYTAAMVEDRERTRPIMDPSTGLGLATVAEATGSQVDEAMRCAAAIAPGMERVAPVVVERSMRALVVLLDRDREQLARTIVAEVGKPIGEARAEVQKAIDWFEYFAGWPSKISGETLSVSLPGMAARTIRRPVGPVVAITPWNYPLMIAAWKVAPAIAARCPVVLKPSEVAPLSALRLGALAVEAGWGASLQVVTGGGDVGSWLTVDRRAAMVSFTGSLDVGRQVGLACGQHFRRCNLELGGKSALIVDGEISMERGSLIAAAVTHNAGQACNAPGRLLVPQSVLEKGLAEIEAALQDVRVGMPLEERTEMGPVVSAAQSDRIERLLAEAEAHGDEVQRINGWQAHTEGGHWVAPAIVRVKDLDSPAWRQEIFGPVLVVAPYRTIEAAIAEANAGVYGLAAGVLTDSHHVARQVAAQLRVGHVYVNHWSAQDPAAPFGGFRGSGVGRTHGREGLDAYLSTTTVWDVG